MGNHQIKILALVDREESRQELASALAMLDCALDLARSAQDAAQRLKRAEFAALIIEACSEIDVSAPHLIDSIRAVAPETPIVLISPKDLEASLVDQWFSVGISDVLTRPFHPAILKAKIKMCLDLHRSKSRRPREVNSLLKNGIEESSDAIFTKDLEGRYTLVNTTVARIMGKNADEILGKDDAPFFPPEMLKKIQGNDKKVIETGQTINFDESGLFNGIERRLITTKSPLRDDQGKIVGVIGVAHDVAEFKRVEEERNRFFEISADMLCIAEHDGYLKRANPAFERTLGYSQEELLSRPFLEFVLPEDQEATKAELLKVVRGIPIEYFENRYRCKNGDIKWLAWASLSFGNQFFAVARDVTTQKRSQLELEVSETRFRKLFEESPMAIEIFRPDGQLMHVNRAWQALWDIDAQVLEKSPLSDYNVLQNPQLVAKNIMPHLKKGFLGEATAIPPFLYNPAEVGRPGRTRQIDGYIYPIKNPDGAIREVVVTQRDMSDQIQSESILNLLAETGELLATSLDYQATLNRIADLAIKWLGGWCEIFAFGENGVLEQKAVSHTDPEKAGRMRDFRKAFPLNPLASHGPGQVIGTGKTVLIPRITDEMLESSARDENHLAALRETGITSFIGIPLRVSGETFGLLAIATDKKSYDSQDLSLAQELANRASLALQNAKLYDEAQRAIRLRDEFISIASHELKTPLTPLNLQMQIFTRLHERDGMANVPREEMSRMLQTSSDQLRSLIELVETLLDVSRISRGKITLSRRDLDLSEFTRKVIDRFAHQLREAGCDAELEANEAVLGSWDPIRIEQIVINLLTNAMRYGAKKPIRVRVWIENGAAKLSVQDFGIGIAKEDQDRIFERFERAGSIYKFGGMGLGLYITREIVRSHGGSVEAKSELGQGATFTVMLPLSPPSNALGAENFPPHKN